MYGYMSVYLRRKSSSDVLLKRMCVVLRTSRGSEFRGRSTTTSDILSSAADGESYETAGWSNFVRRSVVLKESSHILDQGTLTFEVRISIQPDGCHCDAKPQTDMSKNMLKLLQSEDIVDVAFQVKGKIFYAHRLVIKAQAPELAELCEGCDCTTPMSISDVEPDIFQMMINYIYSGTINDDDWKKNSACILRAAGKYGCNSLRLEAEQRVVKNANFTVDNAISMLLEADGNNFFLLKKAAMKFVVENLEDVINSGSYTILHQSPSLTKEVMLAMSKKVSDSKKRRRDE